MHCEDNHCIWWQKNECTLGVISIDSQGHCEECIEVFIEENLLAVKRRQARKCLETQEPTAP